VLQSLQRWWPPLSAFCRELELELGHQVQANAYLTPSGAAGLAPHHDTHDVFVLQVAGAKHWTIAEPAFPAPLRRHGSDHGQAATQPVLFDADLGPGDSLYLPRGYVHSARAQQGVSLHLTIGVLATTVHDLARRLVDRAADEEVFRRALPVGYPDDPALAVRAVKDTVAELLSWLERLDPEPVAEDLRDRFWRRRPQLLGGQLLQLVELDRLGDDSVVWLRPRSAARIVSVADRVVVGLGDRRVELPAVVEPVLRRLTDGRRHRVGDLADLIDGPSRIVLTRRLIHEGLLEAEHGG
jgi:bifunctional lysine-specific demethylase and histidyl-hydroxylase NO66